MISHLVPAKHRRTGGLGWGAAAPPTQFLESSSIRAKIILSFGLRRSGDHTNILIRQILPRLLSNFLFFCKSDEYIHLAYN